MKFSRFLFTLSLLTTACIAVVENIDGSVDDIGSPAIDKSSHKLGVQPLADEDNAPAPKHAKKPLDPYNNGGKTAENASSEDQEEAELDGFIMSCSMIVVSEIGDKTFLIAALMAMKNSRVVVFTAAFASLIIMTVLSGVIGNALPNLLSRRVTQFLASILFVVFGSRLLREGLSMSKDVGVEEEMAEVEEEIAASKLNTQLDDVEAGTGASSVAGGPPINKVKYTPFYVEFGNQIQNLASFIFTPVWIQVFVMTFLGEWGDRSQIATIAMAAGSNYWIVIIGAIVGHGFCTALACLGGKLLAKKISLRTVTLGGSIAFFIFSLMYFYEAYYNIES
ncbi:GCR1-dependent translation factor 1 [Candida viswanathii]|uniref:GDT1 family protein n=1 Tax=Candida viswanathii TaxID=5486 RepID=A0A367XRW6_9ASCO|nr:GCR1-dependent translation factor 1 [Candida viswanathii]